MERFRFRSWCNPINYRHQSPQWTPMQKKKRLSNHLSPAFIFQEHVPTIDLNMALFFWQWRGHVSSDVTFSIPLSRLHGHNHQQPKQAAVCSILDIEQICRNPEDQNIWKQRQTERKTELDDLDLYISTITQDPWWITRMILYIYMFRFRTLNLNAFMCREPAASILGARGTRTKGWLIKV